MQKKLFFSSVEQDHVRLSYECLHTNRNIRLQVDIKHHTDLFWSVTLWIRIVSIACAQILILQQAAWTQDELEWLWNIMLLTFHFSVKLDASTYRSSYLLLKDSWKRCGQSRWAKWESSWKVTGDLSVGISNLPYQKTNMLSVLCMSGILQYLDRRRRRRGAHTDGSRSSWNQRPLTGKPATYLTTWKHTNSERSRLSQHWVAWLTADDS
jgi:hypothetical protein